jgi:AraC-like DNA-binding protein
MDALSRILDSVRVSGSLFSRAELSAPWGVHTLGTDAAIFHVVLRGAGWATAEGGRPQAFRAGDLLVFPHGHPHTLRDAPDTPTAHIAGLPRVQSEDRLACVAHGGGGPRTSVLCGTFTLDPDARDFLLPLLPPLLHVRGDSPTAAWMDATLKVMADEVSADRPGSSVVIARLADILFVQVLRAWASEGAEGWLGALEDPQVSRALELIHEAPAERWTAALLARKVGMSRSAFYSRFTDQVGEAPSSYLTRWRMRLARGALRESDAGLYAVAEQVGYTSEASFCRAFKRHVGVSPGSWRRQQSGAGAASPA